jgi:ligand-binding sensor domain-containing protein
MGFFIYSRHFLKTTSLIFTALICLGAVHFREIRDQQVGFIQSEASSKELIQPEDTLRNSIFVDTGTLVKTFRSVVVDNDNNKWFITEQGIVSFNGDKWTLHNKNKKVPVQDLKDFALEVNPYGQELWIASPKGATVATIPVDGRTGATTYHTENTPILNNDVVQVAIGKSPMRWFGTAKGISAFRNDKWLKGDYAELYPEELFHDYPITAMATNADGDSLYVATDGAGIARVQRNDVDGITGASVYAQWGPILLPSDKVYSVLITSDNTQWFGTDKGIARHIGNNTLANWTVFTTKDGLIDNFVQAIATDKLGQIWIGTRGGVSLFDGSAWTSFTTNNGLNSNNILCITIDKTGVVWLGTDDGVTSYVDHKFTNYR